MAKKGVTSNFARFNKNQRLLIDRFSLGVSASVGDYIRASVTVAKELGLERINVKGIEDKNPPIVAKGQRIYNPIIPYKSYKTVREKKDVKKFLIRTGELSDALGEVGEFTGLRNLLTAKNRSRNSKFIVETSKGVVRGKIIFSGNPARAINTGGNKASSVRLRGRRRIMESSFSKTRGIWKKNLINKRLLSRNA